MPDHPAVTPPPRRDRPGHRLTLGVGRFVLGHRIWVAGSLGIVTALMLAQARNVTYDFGIRKFFPDESPLHEPFLAAEEIFGRDDGRTFVAFDLPEVFTPSGMSLLRELTAALAAVDGIDEVTSLANVDRLIAVEDGVRVQPLVPDELTSGGLAAAREAVRGDPLLRGLYLSEDEQAVVVLLDWGVPRTESKRRQAVGRAVDEVVAGFAERPGREAIVFHQGGLIRNRNIYGRLLLEDNRTLIPGVLVGMLVILFVVFRRLSAVVWPVVLVAMALIWALGLTVLLGRPLNMITNIVSPVVLVVGIADSIHILNCYREMLQTHKDRRRALEETIAEMALACMLTSFTTMVGFGVLLLTDIPILREFGLICAVGVGASYICTVLGLPIAMSLAKPLGPPAPSGLGGLASAGLAALSNLASAHRRKILAVTVVASVAAGLVATRVQRDAKVLEDLRDGHPEVVARKYIEDRFGGAMPIAVLVRGEPDDIRDPAVIRGLAATAAAMAAEDILALPLGLHTIIETLHAALVPEDPEPLPVSRELMAQELLLYEMSGDERLEDFVAGDFSAARVMARAEDALTTEVEQMRERLEQRARAAFPARLRVDVTSTMVLAQLVNRTLIANLVSSFLTAFLVIFFTMLLMFRSLSLALLALIPNVAPMFVLVAFMAVSGIGLKVSTAFIFAISFGIAVDDTIHFLARIRRERAEGRGHEEAVRIAVTGTGRAMVQTTLVLVLGFGFLLTSEFLANFNFGLLSGVTLSAALIADLTLLPALLLTTRRW